MSFLIRSSEIPGKLLVRHNRIIFLYVYNRESQVLKKEINNKKKKFKK